MKEEAEHYDYLLDKYKDALEDMVNQFAYPGIPVKGVSSISTGGLSALEEAFDALGYSDPQSMPHKQCQYPIKPKCTDHVTCGLPTKKHKYLNVCSDHYKKLKQEGDIA